MRFVALAAAAAALWIQPAQAAILFQEIYRVGADFPTGATLKGPPQKWTITLLDPIPEGTFFNSAPYWNDFKRVTHYWTADGIGGDVMVGEPARPPSQFSFGNGVYKFVDQWNVCETAKPVIGARCGVTYEAYANSSWYALVSNDPTKIYPSVRFLLTITTVPEPSTWAMMILGIGFTGAAFRRRQGVTVTDMVAPNAVS